LTSVKQHSDRWSPYFYKQSPIFDPISLSAKTFNLFSEWPELSNYNQLLHKKYGKIESLTGSELKFIHQKGKPETINDEYEVSIYKTGEIQTRLHNWHDFFQVMVWSTFPITKKLINKLHATALINRKSSLTSKQRSLVENSLTLFDECGAIILCSNKHLINLIKEFSWKELFVTHRSAFENEIKCVVFGHAMFEKSLDPYLGMTTHSILLTVDHDFFNLNTQMQYKHIDKLAACYFSEVSEINKRILHPFPVLGVPGWDKRNETPEYYDNKEYFRNKPTK